MLPILGKMLDVLLLLFFKHDIMHIIVYYD